MRRLVIVGGLVVVLAAAGFLGFLRVPGGEAAWRPAPGDLKVAGASSLWLPRWRWQRAGSGRLTATVQASSSEGASVELAISVDFPAGSHRLAAAASAEEGLRDAVGSVAKGNLAAVSLLCLAGLTPGDGCPKAPRHELATALASHLNVPSSAVTVELVVDQQAVAAARLAELRSSIGSPPRRVQIIGLDGADWEVLEPLVGRGAMPNLAGLMKSGAWGELASFKPILSPLIWTTMATGVGPEEHGILDFVEVDPASGAKVPITGRQRRVPALWNIASAAGMEVAVSGWWASWPAEPVNGVLVSDRLFFLLAATDGEAPDGTVVFPPDEEQRMRELARRAEEETDEGCIRSLLPVSAEAYLEARRAGRGMADPIDGFRRIMVGTRIYFGAALAAAERRPDLLMVYCIGTDEIGHLLAPYLPPPLPGVDPEFAETALVGVERYFNVVDRWIGRLVAACPPEECATVVVSDHGFKWGADRPRDFSGTAAATAALWHRLHGIFVVAGHGVTALGRVSQVPSVRDVGPTVAALLGLPSGDSWPGTTLPGCPTATAQPVAWAELVPPEMYRPQAAAARPSQDHIEQLKALGYLESSEGTGTGEGQTEGELNNLGLVQLDAKQYEEAEETFKQAIQRNPAYASPHYNLRRLFFETGRYEEADAALLQAVDLGLRDGAGALDRAATDYEGLGEPARAIALLQAGVGRFPGECRLATHLLALLLREGLCAEGVEAGNGLVEACDADARFHAFFGLVAGCAGELELARRELTRSLELDPQQPELHEALRSLEQ